LHGQRTPGFQPSLHFSERSVITQLQNLSSGRPWSAKLLPNCGGRVANPFDCARQLIFGNAKMPGPIFNVVLVLDNDFAAVRSCFTDHLFGAPGYTESKQGRVGFVPHYRLDGGNRSGAQAQAAHQCWDVRYWQILLQKTVEGFLGQ
jgi:hypothetical protein